MGLGSEVKSLRAVKEVKVCTYVLIASAWGSAAGSYASALTPRASVAPPDVEPGPAYSVLAARSELVGGLDE